MKREKDIRKQKFRVALTIGILLGAIWALLIPSSAHAFRLTMAWDPNTETDLAGYKIYIGYNPRKYAWVIDAGDKNQATIDNLETGRAYFFTITAYNLKGVESGFSNEVRFPDWPYKLYIPLFIPGEDPPWY